MSQWLGVGGATSLEDTYDEYNDDEHESEVEDFSDRLSDEELEITGEANLEEEKRKVEIDHDVLDFLKNSKQRKNIILREIDIQDRKEEWKKMTKR